MKKCFLLFLVTALITGLLAGCQSSAGDAGKASFIDIAWTRSTEADTEFLQLRADGQFRYYCSCGNSVNDSDLCSGYRYDAETNTIFLTYPADAEDVVTQIIVKSYTEDTLVLDFNGDVRTFVTQDAAEPTIRGLIAAADGTALTYETISISGETLTIDTTSYELMQYKPEIFSYSLAKEGDYQENMVYLFEHPQWDILYYNGDVFVPAEAHAQACAHYADEENFLWSVSVDTAQTEDFVTYPLSVTQAEIEELATMEKRLGDETLFFDKMQQFATISKTSKDGMIRATIQLAFYEGVWYWRSERIDENQEHWPEFVCRLPATLNDKILAAGQ